MILNLTMWLKMGKYDSDILYIITEILEKYNGMFNDKRELFIENLYNLLDGC